MPAFLDTTNSDWQIDSAEDWAGSSVDQDCIHLVYVSTDAKTGLDQQQSWQYVSSTGMTLVEGHTGEKRMYALHVTIGGYSDLD